MNAQHNEMTMDEMDQVVDGVSAGAPFRLRNRSTVITEAPLESLIFDMAFVLPPLSVMIETFNMDQSMGASQSCQKNRY